MKKILVLGGSGFVGKEVISHLCKQGYYVKAVERKTKIKLSGVEIIPAQELDLEKELVIADVVINFSGANIASSSWTQERKKELWNSRVGTTEKISEALKKINKDFLFINASAIGYYGFGEDLKTEESRPGNDFLSQLCQAWESKVIEGNSQERRSVILRIGLVLGKDGGALKPIIASTKLFMGSIVGSGEQAVSWIYVKEIAQIIEYLIVNPKVSGAINLTTGQVSFKELMEKLGRSLHRPILLKVPGWLIKLLLGERAGLLLESARVEPARLQQLGYQFKYPDLDSVFQDMLK